MAGRVFWTRAQVIFWVLGVTLLVSGCKRSEGQNQPTGQAVAHVGSEDITTSELQLETRASPNQKAATDQDRAIALQRIAARKALAQKAIAQGIDRQPTILLEIRRAKDEILANAIVLADVRNREQKITLDQVNTYIAKHPYQFASRALFQVSELILPQSKDISKILNAVKSATTLDQVEGYLTSNKIPFEKKNVELDTASLPESLTKAFLQPGNIPLVRTPSLSIFMQVKHTQAAPIDGANAEKLARARMVRELYDEELATPAAGDDVSYAAPYRGILEKMNARPKSDKGQK